MHKMENTHVLNGFVENDSISESDVSAADIEYEFVYSNSDQAGEDGFVYGFEAYPSIEKWIGALDVQGIPEPTGIDTNSEKRKLSTLSKSSTIYVANSLNNKTIAQCRDMTTSVESTKLVALSPNQRNNSSGNHETAGNQADTRQRSSRERKTSAVSMTESNKSQCNTVNKGDVDKRKHGKVTTATTHNNKQKLGINYPGQRKKSVSFDPALDKASAFLHSGGKNFSRANTSLIPVRFGLKSLQMNYTETNLQTNESVIFLDLLKTSHQKNDIRGTAITNIEKRLENKRKNPHYFTSFYEHKKLPDPLQRDLKKTARSVAQKKLERKEKIKSTTDEMLTGYVPTVLTMKILEQEEVEDIGRSCRYLRCKTPTRSNINKINNKP